MIVGITLILLDVVNVCTRPHKFVDCPEVVKGAVGVEVFVMPATATIPALTSIP